MSVKRKKKTPSKQNYRPRTVPHYQAGLRPGESMEAMDAARRQAREGMGWRFEGLDDWPMDAIFQKLRDLGIDTDEQRFPEQAASYSSMADLIDAWTEDFPPNDLWVDFPLIAIDHLWRKLTPDIVWPERIAALLNDLTDGYSTAGVGDVPPAITEFMNYMEMVPQAEMRERFEHLQKIADVDIPYLSEDIILSIGDENPETAIRLYNIIRASDPMEGNSILSALAEVLWRLGRPDEARRLVEEMIEMAPDRPETYERALMRAQEMGDYEAMLRYGVKVLELEKNPAQWDTYLQIVQDIFLEAEREDGFEIVRQSVSRPIQSSQLITQNRSAENEPIAHGFDVRPTSDLYAPARSTRTVGRNDPCPCGSGQKYKRCHGR